MAGPWNREHELADVTGADLALAAKLCLARYKFFPTVAEIFEVLQGAQDCLAPASTAMEAWGQVMRAIDSIGVYRPMPDFEDPIIVHVVKALGWRNVCLVESDQVMVMRAHFFKAYETERRREKDRHEMQRVPEFAQLIQQVAARLSAPTRERS